SGLVTPDEGEVRFLGQVITRLAMHKRIRLGLARSFQIVSVFHNLTAFENVRIAVQANERGAHAFWRDAHAGEAVNARTLSAMSDRITVLHQGKLIADGKPAEVAANPEVMLAYLGTAPGSSAAVAASGARPAVAGGPLLQVRHLAAGYGGGRILDGIDFHVGE